MLKLREYTHFTAVLVIIALLALSSVVSAQASPVGYRVEFVNGIGLHIVQVNMGSPSVKVTPVLSKRFPGGAEPLSTICAREKPVAAITGTYFSNASLLPIGDIMIDGRLVHFGGMGSALAITPDNRVEFRRIPWGRQQEWGPYETVMAAGPMLVEGGEVALAPRHEKFRDPHVLGRAARAAVGITAKNKLLMVTTRQSVSLWQLAKVMQQLGCTEAINLDGGSSTGLYYRGSTIVRPTRSLVNVLGVYVDVDPGTRICQTQRIKGLTEVDSYRMARAHETYLQAQTPLARGQLAEAAGLLSRATELDPGNASYHVRLAETLARMGDGAAAACAWSRAGEILVAKERWAEALTQFQAALERDPANQVAKEGLPVAYRGLGMETRARAAEGQLIVEAVQETIIATLGSPGTLIAELVHESAKLTGLSAQAEIADTTLSARMAAGLLGEPELSR